MAPKAAAKRLVVGGLVMQLSRLVIAAALATGPALVAVPGPAYAASISASIDVAPSGGAVGLVSGIAGTYTSILTATGGGTCALLNAAAVIADVDNGEGNPSRSETDGACTLLNASVDYTLTYRTALGVSGTFYRTCVWEFGAMICSPRGVSF